MLFTADLNRSESESLSVSVFSESNHIKPNPIAIPIAIPMHFGCGYAAPYLEIPL